jgi:hypothetical protein
MDRHFYNLLIESLFGINILDAEGGSDEIGTDVSATAEDG